MTDFREKKTDPAGAGPLGAGSTWLFERAQSSQRGHVAQGFRGDTGPLTKATGFGLPAQKRARFPGPDGARSPFGSQCAAAAAPGRLCLRSRAREQPLEIALSAAERERVPLTSVSIARKNRVRIDALRWRGSDSRPG